MGQGQEGGPGRVRCFLMPNGQGCEAEAPPGDNRRERSAQRQRTRRLGIQDRSQSIDLGEETNWKNQVGVLKVSFSGRPW